MDLWNALYEIFANLVCSYLDRLTCVSRTSGWNFHLLHGGDGGNKCMHNSNRSNINTARVCTGACCVAAEGSCTWNNAGNHSLLYYYERQYSSDNSKLVPVVQYSATVQEHNSTICIFKCGTTELSTSPASQCFHTTPGTK